MTHHHRYPIRQAEPSDLEAIARLWRVSFSMPKDAAETLDRRLRLHRVLVADDGTGLVATAQGYDLRQWFGGRPLPTVGVAGVAADPLVRGTGVGTAVVMALLERARSQGRVFATLYPATVPVYRRMGFEYAGIQTAYRVPIAALPTGREPGAELVPVPDDGGPARASFERLARSENGLTEGEDDDWWPSRVLNETRSEPHSAVMTAEEVPDGYAAFREHDLTGAWGYRVACTHLVAHTRAAASALLAFFARFKGVGMELEWFGPPTEPLAMVFAEQSLTPVFSFRNMSRILDVSGALEARGYPDVTGAATFVVDDPAFEDNRGPFRVEAERGKVRVERAHDRDAERHGAIAIGSLSALFTGYLTVPAALRMGLVDEAHPALELLGRLFAGPAPWTPDFF